MRGKKEPLILILILVDCVIIPSSIINHQPSTINHQPSTINHQSSIINHWKWRFSTGRGG